MEPETIRQGEELPLSTPSSEPAPDVAPAVLPTGAVHAPEIEPLRTAVAPRRVMGALPQVTATAASAGTEPRPVPNASRTHMGRATVAANPRGVSTAARWRRYFVIGSCANLVAVLVLCYLLHGLSEDWWVSAALVFLPRQPYLLPAFVLCMWSFKERSGEWFAVNLVSLCLVAGPVMGLCLPVGQLFGSESRGEGKREDLRIVTCNVQGFTAEFDDVLQDIFSRRPDVVLLQEAVAGNHNLDGTFADWQRVQVAEYFVASRYPLRLVSHCESPAFERYSGIHCVVELPGGPVSLFNIHPTSPRHGLTTLRAKALWDERGHGELDRHTFLRMSESAALRTFVDEQAGNRPFVVAGDFNMVPDSSLFVADWSSLTNAFTEAGWGYGYTAPCKRQGPWPAGFPWGRVDHVLCSEVWQVTRCEVGISNGSDHRLVAAKLRRNVKAARE